jgi:hypothetical protein
MILGGQASGEHSNPETATRAFVLDRLTPASHPPYSHGPMFGFPALRRTFGCTLLAAMLAAAATPHRHFGPADEGTGQSHSPSVLTHHNPRSTALHWHAVLKTLYPESCWACHWNRLLGLGSADSCSPVLLSTRRLAQLPPRSALSVARFTRLSRGPPPPLPTS